MKTLYDHLILKEIPDPQFSLIVIGLFAIFGVSVSNQKSTAEPQLQVGYGII